MSTAAYLISVRNYLRSNLTNFYAEDNDHIARNCKVMLDERTTADSGQEFIAIYADYHTSTQLMEGVEEELGVVIAVSQKIAVIPPDYRGEKGYIDIHPLPTSTSVSDETRFLNSWKSLEARCREIARLIGGVGRYEIMSDTNTLLDSTNEGVQFIEPLEWLKTDAKPELVGAEHFFSFYDKIPDSDPTFGLIMRVYFGKAKRLQPNYDWDRGPVD